MVATMLTPIYVLGGSHKKELKMKTRKLGKTEIKVSELVLGGGYVGGIFLQSDEKEKLRAIQHAINSGINLIDTAPSYGNGESERAVGKLLSQLTPRPYLATKVQIDPLIRKDLAGQVEKSITGSLTRLETSSVDLIQLHNPLSKEDDIKHLGVDHLLGKNGVIKALQKAKDSGLTKYIGMTALGNPASCQIAIKTAAFDTAQVYYNMLNPSADITVPNNWTQTNFLKLMTTCEDYKIGIMNIRVFAAGILASTKRTGREIAVTRSGDFKFEEDEQRAEKLFRYLPKSKYTMAQQALRFSLANQKISCVILGLASFSELKESLHVASAPPMDHPSLEKLKQVYNSNYTLTV